MRQQRFIAADSTRETATAAATSLGDSSAGEEVVWAPWRKFQESFSDGTHNNMQGVT